MLYKKMPKMRNTNGKRIKKISATQRGEKEKMSRSQNQAESSEIEQIKKFIISFGFEGVSDSSSQNKIYSKNGTIITIRDPMCISKGDV